MNGEVRIFYDEPLDKLVDAMRCIPWTETTICCVGTDRSTGDALGPLVGTKLKQLGIPVPVVGDLAEPLHAENLTQRLRDEVYTPYVLGVDACLGRFDDIGIICFEHRPLRPGSGVKKNLPEVGNWTLKGVVNAAGFWEYLVLQNTRLHIVMTMADVIANAIHRSICGDIVKFQQEAMVV
jgi:putative sporulation protein YyaC